MGASLSLRALFILLSIHLLFTKRAIGQDPHLILPIGHTSSITSAQYSPDGKKILTASLDGTAKVWESSSGYLLADLNCGGILTRYASFSADGKWIVTASDKDTIKIWSAMNGTQTSEFAGRNPRFNLNNKILLSISNKTVIVRNYLLGNVIAELNHDSQVDCAEFNPAGNKIITISANKDVYLWNAATGSLLSSFKNLTNNIKSAQISPDEKCMLLTCDRGNLEIRDLSSGELLHRLTGHSATINKTLYSPDGKYIITASDDSTAKVWSATTGQIVANLSGHTGEVNWAEISRDNKIIVTSSNDNTIKLWSLSGTLLNTFKGHYFWVSSAVFSPDGKKILSASWDLTAKIWDIQTGKIIQNLSGHTSNVSGGEFNADGKKFLTSTPLGTTVWSTATCEPTVFSIGARGSNIAAFSPDGKKIGIGTLTGTIFIWDVDSSKYDFKITGHPSAILSLKFSSDGKKILTSSISDSSKVWDASKASLLSTLKGTRALLSNSFFSPDGNKIVSIITNDGINTPVILDASSGEILLRLNQHPTGIMSAAFNPDGDNVMTSAERSTKIWDASHGRLLRTLNGDNAKFSPDGKKIVITRNDSIADIYSPVAGSLLATMRGQPDDFNVISFSNDGKKIVTASEVSAIKVWDASSGLLLTQLTGHKSFISFAQFSPDDNKILTGSYDNTARLWDAKTGKLICTFFTVDSNGYMVQVPDRYYQCSPGAAEMLHYVSKDLTAISFEQLDIKFNRPDKVLEAVGNKDTALIKAYRNAYYKRVKKLGVDTLAFQNNFEVPQAGFIDRDKIEYEQTQERLELHIHAEDSLFILQQFNVWVNQVPLFGLRGIGIQKHNSHTFDTTISIALLNGKNRIETAFRNINGIQSYRSPLFVNYTPQPGKGKKKKIVFVGIGINQFADAHYNLNWSVKDIRDLALLFKSKYGDNCRVDTLFNADVVLKNITLLKSKLLQTDINDVVIVAYSGHGLLNNNYDYYLSSYNVNFDAPEQNGIPYDELEQLLDSIPARRKLLFVDACNSGEVDKEDMQLYEKVQERLNGTKTGYKLVPKTKTLLGIQNTIELMQQLFVNVSQNTGATIIAAASGTQFAFERNLLKNSVFTYCILEFLASRHTATVSELKDYVNKKVSELTSGMQQPTERSVNRSMDWDIW